MRNRSTSKIAAALFITLVKPAGAAPTVPLPAPAVEFGTVTLDISRAKAVSRMIPERKTIKKIQKATAHGALRFRSGASGTYRIVTSAVGSAQDDQGAIETTVSISIPRSPSVLDVLATAQRSWSVPTQVPEFWPERESPYEPIFRGPNAKRDKRDYRRKKAQRDAQKRLNQQQARNNYRRSAIAAAFSDSLQDARDDAENQLRKALETEGSSPQETQKAQKGI